MDRIRHRISTVLALVLFTLGFVTTAEAQRRPYRMSDRQVNTLIQRVENSADRFRASIDNALDRSAINGTRTEDEINAYIRDFEQATDQLRSRFDSRNAAAADVENVLNRAAFINQFLLNNRLGARVNNDWALVRTDLNALARAYNVTWDWNRQVIMSPTAPVVQRAYRLTDREVDAIIQRVETNSDRFRSSLDTALDRSRWDGTRAENNINAFVRDFEQATDRLRANFNSNRSVDEDVHTVLSHAASIDAFMRNNRLTNRAQNDWTMVRTDLTTLANAYDVAWNWNAPTTYPSTGTVAVNPRAVGRLNGTYRLDPARGDNPRDVADRATRHLPLNERQRVYDRVLARLEAPTELAIERRGNTVDIASSRAPRTTFEADGQERTEQLPNGVTARVSATLQGDRLEVRSTGFRENDFQVVFDPIEQGRRLRVTRRIFSERFDQPVIVISEYDKVSDVARFDIQTQTYPSSTSSTSPNASGEFIIRNGETLVAVLDRDLSTRTVQPGERFTLTVRQPGEFEGAVIEGSVASTDRGGRITGRSEMSFDLDTIRLRDGRTYRFAGFVESVQTASGEVVRVDNEGTVRDNSQTDKTVQRTAIGTAVGAIIGAIAGGGKGAAIGAVIGAAGGAGSVYVQGRDDLDLLRGTEFTIRASAPNR